MTDIGDRSFVSSVVFLEFVDYTKKTVADQIKFKERFNALLADTLTGIAAADRIVLDASTGAAISFIDDPENALFVAMRLRDAAAADQVEPRLELRIGINTGAVKLAMDAHGRLNIVGDGIDVAQRVMSFAEPGALLASRAFYELVSVLSQEHAQLFRFDGARTDHQIREHQVFRVGTAAHDLRGRTHSQAPAAKRGQQLWIAASLASVLILALAVGVRLNRAKPVPEQVAAPAATAVAQPPAAPAVVTPAVPKAAKPKAPKARLAAGTTAPATAEPPPAPALAPVKAAPGSIGFAITPWGEIYVDGTKRGVSPPLREVQIAPGKHTIEVRNTSFPSYSTAVEVTSGAQAKIRYKFQ